MELETHKSGFVNIIGKPNVGKSTLINAMLGEKLCIITNKAQTTRHRIFGIHNTENVQIVFSDTPGIIDHPAYKLQEKMMEFVNTAYIDADLFLYVVEANMTPSIELIPKQIVHTEVPVFIVINKIDLSNPDSLEELVNRWLTILPKAKMFPIAALHNFNTTELLAKVIEQMPVHPPYYDKEALTDKPERFFVSEIVREKILLNYEKEIPYSTEVFVLSFKEKEGKVYIECEIHVMRESQKGILIGSKGIMLKKLLDQSKKDIEHFLQQEVFLFLKIKVKDDWRNNDLYLKQKGYSLD